MNNEQYDIIVIGGGPSGMMAAGRAGEVGAKVLLIEKNDRLGKKLSITGGRRCNITNAEFDDQLFLDNFPKAKQHLQTPLSQFNVESTFDFFENRNLPIMVEDGKRAFPESESAEDVCDLLIEYVEESGNVEVKLDTALESLVITDGKLVGVKTSSGTFQASRVILATGGLAAPDTGSTGEGLSMLASIGHTVSEPNPSLVPLKSSAKWVHALSGLTIDNVALRFVQDGKIEHSVNGRILFTHFGISGPTVINAAHVAKDLLKKGKLTASLDLFPDRSVKQMDEMLKRMFNDGPKKLLKGVLRELLQKKIQRRDSGQHETVHWRSEGEQCLKSSTQTTRRYTEEPRVPYHGHDGIWMVNRRRRWRDTRGGRFSEHDVEALHKPLFNWRHD